MAANFDGSNGFDVGVDVVGAVIHRRLLDAAVAVRDYIPRPFGINGQLARVLADFQGSHSNLVGTDLHGANSLPKIRVRIDAVASWSKHFTHDAALAIDFPFAVASEDVALIESLLGDDLAEVARQHEALADRHVHHGFYFVAPENRIQKVSSFLPDIENDSFVAVIGR